MPSDIANVKRAIEHDWNISSGWSTLKSCLALVIAASFGVCHPALAAGSWKPEVPEYGYAVKKDVPVKMDDGVVLSADIYYPTVQATGLKSPGRFPVLLEQTPYGKERTGFMFGKTAKYFVRRGYILVVADLRGFGQSEGQAAWFGARMGKDGVALVNWAAHLKDADGKVGLMGCSYLGVVQFFTAKYLPEKSPVKAIAPFCADSNFYRDLTAMGGIPTQFVDVDRVVTAPSKHDHPGHDPFMNTIISEGNGKNGYYDRYWRGLNVTAFMPRIVSLGIPILSETGWHDIFPGGNLDAEVAAENAYYHRPLSRPLQTGEPETGLYQAIVGPWKHGEHVAGALQPVLLEWFDTWLKGEHTGMASTTRPLHLFIMGENRWANSSTYPLTDRALSFALSPGRMEAGVDVSGCKKGKTQPSGCEQTIFWSPVSKYTMLKFESPVLTVPVFIGGPSDLTIFLKSTRPEVELSASLYAVSPGGRAEKLSSGAQLGSLRMLDERNSWYSKSGILVRPEHYFTRAKMTPVPVDRMVEIDIEMTPTIIRIPAGYRLELRVYTQPPQGFRQFAKGVQMRNPLLPTPTEERNLLGGIYTVLYGSDGHSRLNLSVASMAGLRLSKKDWGPVD